MVALWIFVILPVAIRTNPAQLIAPQHLSLSSIISFSIQPQLALLESQSKDAYLLFLVCYELCFLNIRNMYKPFDIIRFVVLDNLDTWLIHEYL